MSGIEEYAILNDIHFPYESPHYDLVISFLESRPLLKHIYLNGDILELEAPSRHLKDPRGIKHVQYEFDYGNMRLDEIEGKFSGIPVTFLEGNHCYRFARFISERCPELFGLRGLTVSDQLLFSERSQFTYVPYGPSQLSQCGASKLFLRHEPLSGGVGCARKTAQESLVDLAFGHTHIYEVGRHRKFGPEPKLTTAYSLGWLGNRDASIFNYRSAKENWTEMFSLVQCNIETGDYHLHAIDVSKGSFTFEGRAYGGGIRGTRR